MNVSGARTGISRQPQKIHFFCGGFIPGAYRGVVGATSAVGVQLERGPDRSSATLPSLAEGADERQRHYSAALVDEYTATDKNTDVERAYTATQGQYLAFIYYDTKLHGVPPAARTRSLWPTARTRVKNDGWEWIGFLVPNLLS
jgi:hypothetical protein